MKLNILENYNFKGFNNIAQIIKANNGKLYLVGGCVRDIFLNKVPYDYDFCVTGISAKQFEQLFPNAKKTR